MLPKLLNKWKGDPGGEVSPLKKVTKVTRIANKAAWAYEKWKRDQVHPLKKVTKVTSIADLLVNQKVTKATRIANNAVWAYEQMKR